MTKLIRKLFRPRGAWLVPLVCLAAGSGSVVAPGAMAQTLDFSVGNFTLEQIVVSNQQNPATTSLPFGGNGDDGNGSGSTSVIAQVGDRNRAATSTANSAGGLSAALQQGSDNYSFGSIRNSPSGVNASLQFGEDNAAVGIIVDSPGSIIEQVQLGTDNTSLVSILGGTENAAVTVQAGNHLGALVALVDSQNTTVVYGQGGENYNGGVVIKNAPAGTRVIIGDNGPPGTWEAQVN